MRRTVKWMRARPGLVGVAALLLTVSAAAGVALAWWGSSTQAAEVEVKQNGVVVSRGSEQEAAGEASRLVGFEVRVPTAPEGSRVLFIDVDLGPEGLPNAMKKALIAIGPDEAAGPRMSVEETGVRFGAPANRAERLPWGDPGVEIYYQRAEMAEGYWVLTKDRGYVITLTGSERPNRGQVEQVIHSLLK